MICRDPQLESLFSVEVRVIRDLGGGGEHAIHPAEAEIVARAAAGRRAEFTSGRVCAHGALDALGAPHAPLLPGPDRAPLWPDGFVGSITHADGACAAVVASRAVAAALGLDVEPLGALPQNLRPRICRPEERRRHEALPAGGPDWALLTFCAKEAFYKAYRPLTGRFLDFHDVSLRFTIPAELNQGTFQAILTDRNLPLAADAEELVGRWRCEPGHLWAAFTWPG